VIARTAMDKVRISRAVSNLLKAGFIARDADPLDRRYAVIGLTTSGREAYGPIVPLIQYAEAEMMSP
jgi:DNA-binding MarR family transcriptional regulator